MAYFAMSPCVQCGTVFSFNPHKVPSVIVNGVREPICRHCVEVANPKRIAGALAPIIILPGAYEPEAEETDSDFQPWLGEDR